ncbi:MAG: ABC transporter permease subunit, partial [bacterium]|nr:ABC transporter permease subunit [bacterium]
MHKVLAIVRRELIAFFSSPLAYVVLATFLLMQGFIFLVLLSALSQPGDMAFSPLQVLFGGNIFFWIYMLVFMPVITMRLVSEELRSGTIETLMTSPVTEAQVIVGKFIAAFIFYCVLWFPTLVYVLVINHYNPIDLGPVAAGYIGILSLGVLFLGVGIFASTLAKNQLISAIIGFTILGILFVIPLVDMFLTSTSFLKPVIEHMSLWTQVERFASGVVDTRHLVYQLSVGALFLFLATKSLEV